MEAAKETTFGTTVAWGMRVMSDFEYMHNAEKVCDTTLDDENASQNVMSVLVTAFGSLGDEDVVMTVLCNQPETFALDLGDNQSHYLYVFVVI